MSDIYRRSHFFRAIYGNYFLFFLLSLVLSSCSSSFGDSTEKQHNPSLQHNTSAAVFTTNRSNISNDRDIWTRIRSGSRIDMSSVNGDVHNLLENYRRNPHKAELLLEESAPYIHYVVEELERYGLPLELALLPAVESAYDPFAYSSGKAVGLWQFIWPTAKFYGLRRDTWYSGQRDVRTSTNAARRYLADLYESSDNNWLHALAGYNAGWTKVSQAIRHNRQNGKSVSAWDLPLPKETLDYVPRFCALALVIRNPEKYGVNLPPIPNRPYFSIVNISSQIDLAIAAELADVPIEEIYRLNPGLSRWATPPQGPHELLLPKEKRAQFLRSLRQLPFEERLGWVSHRVESGESLGILAERFDTNISALQKLNNLEGDLILAGSDLLIPAAAHPPEMYAYNQGSAGKYDDLFALSAEENEEKTQRAYTVRHGDSLWTIARKYGIRGYGKIAKWNDLSVTDPLHPGQKLALWVPDNGHAAFHRRREPVIRKVIYSVRHGDSLSKISERFSTQLSAIADWNSLEIDATIHPGQPIVLYVDILRNH